MLWLWLVKEMVMLLSKRITSAMIVLAVGTSVCLGAAIAQPPATGPQSAGQLAKPRTARENVARLHRVISVDFKEWRLRDVVQHLSTETGAVLEPVWKNTSEDGLDPDMLITFSAKGLDGVTVLERVLEKASGEALTSDDKVTWQMTSYGAIEFGPRKALNRSKRVEVYDVSDLLFEVPVYDDVPTIDLAQVLQNSGGRGGNGGTNIFNDGGSRGGGDRARETNASVSANGWLKNSSGSSPRSPRRSSGRITAGRAGRSGCTKGTSSSMLPTTCTGRLRATRGGRPPSRLRPKGGGTWLRAAAWRRPR
ncbi:MAG: hypothetical protein QM783_14570 [Phycisphaerales bacterium]